MKKILIHLTGLVFLITILLAAGCGNSKKKNDPLNEEKNPAVVEDDQSEVATPNRKPKALRIYLKDTLIDGSMHLLMSNERKPDWKVIDNLVTLVYPGDTVVWKKGQDSKIKKIKYIKIKEVYGTGFIPEVGFNRGLYKLEIPITAKPGIMVYEIGFTVQKDTTTIHIIDPYLRLPKNPK